MQIKQFNKGNIDHIRPALYAALEALKKDFGVDIKIGTLRYDSNQVSGKVTLTTETGVVKAQEFPLNGTKFILKGVSYTVVDYKPRSFKYPYIGENSKGQRFKFTAATVNANKITK